MALQDLADDLVIGIIKLVATDVRCLKSLALVNRRLGMFSRRKLFAQCVVDIRSSGFGMMSAFQPRKGYKLADFITLVRSNLELASFMSRIRVSSSLLTHYETGFPSTLEALVNIRQIEISWPGTWSTTNTVDWALVPQSMQASLLNVVLPRLTRIIFSDSISNLPSNFLDYAPQLSYVDMRSSMGLAQGRVHIRNPAVVRTGRSLQQLKLGARSSDADSTAQAPILRLIEGRLDEYLHLTLEYANPPVLELLKHNLGAHVKTLTFTTLDDTILPFSSLPHLESLSFLSERSDYQVTEDEDLRRVVHPITWLNKSLNGQKDLTLSKICLLFKAFPIHFDASPITKRAFISCDRLLEDTCPKFTSIHAIFEVYEASTDNRSFTVGGVKRELAELFPACFEKGFISVEDATPDPWPWGR
ncbi:hypothetical protein DL96DRAFT_1824348 [Flagelloscypha sp. PMI_526]|nr:hypothetical protein DL96DRAFT_1824348 [Flagelloscypha sp. PMI_526]